MPTPNEPTDDVLTLTLRDHTQPCEHYIPEVDGWCWRDDNEIWFCDSEGCPGGRERQFRLIGNQNAGRVWVEVSDADTQ